jgi:radical SAM superfamily enzyme YgiQ (UPF0313 family)
MLDILIVNVPGTADRTPPAAPALLKASIIKSGFSCKTIDFNIRFYSNKNLNIPDLETYFITGLNNEHRANADDLINEWAIEIASYNPKYVGISVFTYQNRTATTLLCQHLRKYPNIKIILGGQGLSDGSILGMQGYARDMINQNLADFYIKSEGELSLVELLKGNSTYNGINSDSFMQIENLDQLPIPDYKDYEFDLYETKMFPITASRGCVRACSFCDIHDHWKYRYRPGKSVADEMITLSNLYGINSFMFTDSLVNGNLKEFKNFCSIIAGENRKGKNINWIGQYIVRPSTQLDEDYWKNLADSGGHRLAIGVESGSDKVRAHMNKRFINIDLDYTMNMLDKYNITCVFLMIFGYPTETEQDFQDTLDMFKKYSSLANRIIKNINFGSTLGILPGTPLYHHAHQFGIEIDKHENNWINQNNPTLDLAERIRRRNYAREYAVSLGYQLDQDTSEHILKLLEDKLPTFDKRNKLKKLIRIKNDINITFIKHKND